MGLLDLPRFYHTLPDLSSISFRLSVLVHSNSSGAITPVCFPALSADPVQIVQLCLVHPFVMLESRCIKSFIRNYYRFRCPFRLFDCTWIIAHRFGFVKHFFRLSALTFESIPERLLWFVSFGVCGCLGAAKRFTLCAVRFDCLNYSTAHLVCQWVFLIFFV